MKTERPTFLALTAAMLAFAAGLLTLNLGTPRASAQAIFWNGGPAGDFHDPGMWSLPNAPGPQHLVVFTDFFANAPGGEVAVTFTKNASSLLLEVGDLAVSFDLMGNTYDVGTTIDLNSVGILDVNNGTLTAVTTLVGSSGVGVLNIGHDGVASTGAGGTVSTSVLTVGSGNGADGAINLGQDALLESTTATIAAAANSMGAVNVGDGATWVNHGIVTAGGAGTATVTVDDGGLLRSQSLTVTGANATVTASAGGAIVLADTAIDVASLPAAVQDVINNGGLFVANSSLPVALSLANGGTLEAARAFIDSLTAGATAQAMVTNATLDLGAGDLVVGHSSNASLSILEGGIVEAGEAVIGANQGSSGTILVSGANSTLDLGAGDIVVGDAGNGSLQVTGGGGVEAANAFIGASQGSTGAINVTGENSALDLTGDLHVGFNAGLGKAAASANATLDVSNKGIVQVGGGATVHETGILAGDGTLNIAMGAGTLNVFGRLSPGSSIGTLNIEGNLVLESGGILHVEYNSTPIDVMDVLGLDPAALPEDVDQVLLSDLVAVSGTATLVDGTTIEVVKITGGSSPGDAIIVIHSGDGGMDPDNIAQIKGTALIVWSAQVIDHGGDEFLLLIAALDEPSFDEFVAGLPPRLATVAVALEEAGMFDVLVSAADHDDPAAAVTSLLPQQHGAAAVQSIRTAQVFGNSFLGQMAAHRAGVGGATMSGLYGGSFSSLAHDPIALARAVESLDRSDDSRSIAFGALEEEAGRLGGFIQGTGVWERVDSAADRTGHRARIVGGFGGIHYHFTNDFLLGVAGGYFNNDLNFRDNFGEGEIHTFRVGPYLSWAPGGGDFFIDAAATYGYHRNEIDRNVLIPAPATARSKYNAHDFSAVGQAGYDFAIAERTMITPMVGLEYTHLRTDSFTETGPGPVLDVDSQRADSLRLRAGAKLAHAIHIADHVIIPEVYGGWAHEFLDTDLTVHSRLHSGALSAPLTTRVAGVGRNAIQVAGGFTAMAGTYITLYVRYEGEFQSDRTSHGVVGGLNIRF